MRKVFHSRAQAFALDGGDPLVVVVRHEVAVNARLRKASSLQLLKQQGEQVEHGISRRHAGHNDNTKINGTEGCSIAGGGWPKRIRFVLFVDSFLSVIVAEPNNDNPFPGAGGDKV